VISQKQVSATLGKQSLRQGLIAGAVGLVLVIVFLLAYYRLLGVIAAFALLVYGVLFYALVELIPITLTLPGIAGMILTIGVAADASVVIFERVREEARAGKSARAAVISGYTKGISAIIDANVVTLLTAVILFMFATAGVKGFAFTLLFGVILSLFTAVIATRAVFGLVADTKPFRNPRLSGLEQREIRWKMDFVGKWRLWLAISFVPLAIGSVVIAVNGLNLGLDFESGTRVTTSFGDIGSVQPSEQRVRDVVSGLGYDAKIQATTEELDGREVRGFQIQTETLQPNQISELRATMDRELGGVNGDTYQVELVGPTFGRQIIRNAIIAVILSFIVMILYLTIRFEYKLALPALVSVIHDVWLTISIYSVTGREVTSATVAAILTILGYSLYDVVIVFDRIRENLPIMRKFSYREIVNRSIHETLTRSLITAFLTILPVGVLFVFGGDTLKDFAFALLVGLLSGGISSIAIAGPLAALWKEREPEGKKRQARAKKRIRVNPADADVVDVHALARAEAALEGMETERGLDDFEPAGLMDGPGEPIDELPQEEPARAAVAPNGGDGAVSLTKGDDADASDAGDGDSPDGGGDGVPKKPERVRRHRQVQRKKRR
jgi:SecD/SecF fusion protein